MSMAGGFRELNAVQVRVSIDRIEPQIWRRLIVPSHFNVRELHLVLQAAQAISSDIDQSFARFFKLK